ncbi:VOC family protein [Mameliella sediminis]|uniref:VOC family protein n=1 Tax=Mameliella sediminis TaxID=2836866 RepID=UPI001C47BE85|nr:VOC family protein [Mameliella sediminis]MBY6116001.1 VOC family protein [Antarctobacter heliothermus]MBY6145221.1 VOC family protein [Mameliella alba]MBV7394040.1 VOC family protein [Mameliella sediminis]MBY6162046.1 VOC family protein [Mameliella alba]MBY6170516.1 VOC family protein [Mameliella alba]
MELGAFSVSLSVKDLAASRKFYEALGFAQVSGVAEEGWLILRNGDSTIGLFQQMFEGNMLTFNPGWTQEAEPKEAFTDIREIQARLQAQGIEPEKPVEPDSAGPGCISLVDPDGNRVFIDQHVPKP